MKRRFERKRFITALDNDGKTIQSQQKQTDINHILRSYQKTGHLTHIAQSVPTYGDFSNATDYLSAQLLIREAENSFMEIPAEIRARFENDPSLFLEFCSDPENVQEMIDMGLAEDPKAFTRGSSSDLAGSAGDVQVDLNPSPPDGDEPEPASKVQGGE